MEVQIQQPGSGADSIPVKQEHVVFTQPQQHSQLGIPPGLEYLTQIDQILVHQRVEFAEVCLGCEFSNKYEIKNSLGQEIFFAMEDSNCCARQCCGPLRPFEMKITNNLGREVIRLVRPFRCFCPCFSCDCCYGMIEVQSPPGEVIGYVKQQKMCCVPNIIVMDTNKDIVFHISGQCCPCGFCADVEFPVLSDDGQTQVGKIYKQWTGFMREAFTDADNFGITFPMDLNVKMKAVLLGACFLIDFLFFERGNR